ncbi:response regulator transcription factor [Lentibacillus sp. CBA3610]|uniref:response regulator transcription factor n=1 Tax=Lentibacillus sp. CBA3610 TaxID=2518176 RepID=UPI0015952C46|nr:response regulator transcription factor [Lentibacillus sp. CBA3610]QKY70314.1 response regulator transcription factor [Lentibacillus sp. CBA3610]
MIKLLLAEDQRLFLEGVQALIDTQDDMEVIATASNGDQAVELVSELRPDIVLMDIHMPELDGIKATARIKESYPRVKVIMLTTSINEDLAIRGISVGADGFLVKELFPDTLYQAIRDAYRGQVVLSGDVASILARRIRELSMDKSAILGIRLENRGIHLTKREQEIAYLLMERQSNRQIADKLRLGEGTIKNYISEIYQKLGIHNRGQVIDYLHKIYRN